MKVLITSIFTLLFMASAIALPFDDIKVGSNAKTSSLEIRYTSSNKKNKDVTVLILDEKGILINSFTTMVVNGENIIPLTNALDLKQGLYTVKVLVKKKTLSTKLMIFE